MAYKRKEAENMEGLLTNGKKKFVKYDEGAAMFSMGIHSFMDLAKEAKAVYRIRRIVLVNTEIIEEYGDFFDEKKRIIKEAMDRLEKQGFIRRIFRDIVLDSGLKIPNVMYIEIFPERIKEITEEEINPVSPEPPGTGVTENEADHISENVDNSLETMQNRDFGGYPTKNRTTPSEESHYPIPNLVPYPTEGCTHIPPESEGHLTMKRGTNTENTTEITSEDTTKDPTDITNREYSPVMSSQAPDVDNSDDDDEWMDHVDWSRPIKVTMTQPVQADMTGQDKTDKELYIEMLRDQVWYEQLKQEKPFCFHMDSIDGILDIIASIATTKPKSGYERVNGRDYPHEVVKSRLLKMDYETIKYVLDRIWKGGKEIKCMRSYLISALYNAKDEMGLVIDDQVKWDMRRPYSDGGALAGGYT